MKTYLIRLLNETVMFEDVPEAVFNKRKFALTEDGKQRYCDDYVVLNGRTVETMQLNDVNCDVVAVVSRLIGANLNVPTGITSGFVKEPSHIKFKDKRRSWLVELSTGIEYKQVA